MDPAPTGASEELLDRLCGQRAAMITERNPKILGGIAFQNCYLGETRRS